MEVVTTGSKICNIDLFSAINCLRMKDGAIVFGAEIGINSLSIRLSAAKKLNKTVSPSMLI